MISPMCAFLLIISLALLVKANVHEFKVEIVKDWEKEHREYKKSWDKLQYTEYEYLFAVDPSKSNEELMQLTVHKATESYELISGIRIEDKENSRDKEEKRLGNENEKSGVNKKEDKISYETPIPQPNSNPHENISQKFLYKFSIPNDWILAQSELELCIQLNWSGQIILRRFKLQFPNATVPISILPKVEPLSDLKEEQKYRYEIISFNAIDKSESVRIMDYVRLRKRICMSHLEDAYNKILSAKSDNEKFVYGRKLREYGWLAYYLMRYYALMYKEHVKPNCKVNLSVPSEVHILDAIVDSYLSGKSKLKDGSLNKQHNLNEVLDGLAKYLGIKRKYSRFRPPAQYVFVAQHGRMDHTNRNKKNSNDNAADAENGNYGPARKKTKLPGNQNLD